MTMHCLTRRSTVVALLTLLVVLAGACAREPREEVEVETPPPAGPTPDSEQWEAVIRLYETGSLQSVIDARYVAIFTLPARNFTRLDTLEADFFDEEEKVTSHLSANSGEIHDQEAEGNRRVKTWGDVLLVGREGQTVRADTLWWDEVRDRVYTDGPVEVTEEGDVLRGIGFESDTELTEMRIFNVSGESGRGGRWLEEERVEEAAADTVVAGPDSTAVIPPDITGASPDTTVIPPGPDPGSGTGAAGPARRIR